MGILKIPENTTYNDNEPFRIKASKHTTTPNTTRADGAGVGGNGYEIQMPKLEINALGAGGGAKEDGNLWDRIRDTISGGIKQSVGGNVDTMGTMYEATQGQRDTLYDQQREWTAHQLARAEADLAAYTADGNAYMAKVTQGEVERLRTQLNAYDTVKQGRVQQKAATAARDMAAKVTQSGAQDIERAKEGLGLVGQALVDAGASGVQMLGDAGFGAMTGVGGLAPMVFRAFGGGTQKARAEGADLDEQILYGGAQAAKEWVTEKLFSVALPFAKTYGKGSLDDVVEKSIGKAVDRFAKSAMGKRALGGGLTLGAAALGEGLEEGLGTFLEWQMPRIYGGDVASFGETLEEAAYNTLVGSLSGLAGGVVTPQVWNYQQTAPQTAQGGAEAAQEAQNAPTVGNDTPVPSTGEERPQNGAQRPTWGAYMEDGDIFGGGRKTRAGFTSLENAMANQFERETGISIDSVESILGGLANGDYNSANWVARIAQDAKDPKMVVVAHELTHHLQALAPQEYESFRTAVADYFTRAGGEAALTDMMNRYRSAYGAAGQNLSDSAVMDEMAADFTEVLLTDADLFGQFARENRTVAERLLDALRTLIEKIRATFTGRARDAAAQEATGKTLSELEMIAEQWQGVYRAAVTAYGQNANTATQEGDGVRYSFAGINARSANLQQLQTAQEMATRGVDNETIRKETGWFRGMDGKWRFEIDDSNMVYRKEGDALFRKNHPEYAEHQTLTEKFLFGTITAEEQKRLLELEEIWGRERGRLSERVKSGNAKLRDVLQHDALFEAYPQIGNIGVTFADLPNGENASFNRETNTIEISDRLANAGASTLLHEVQHAIQKEEGFARGANPSYWERRINEGYDRRWAGAPLQQMMPSELYRNTAGEIEARDVVERRNLTQQEREIRMPNLGDENTVFTDGNVVEYEIRQNNGKKYLYDIVNINENTGLALDLNQKADRRNKAATQSSVSALSLPNLSDGVKGNMSQLKSTAPLRQMMRDIRMTRLTAVEQDEAEADANENPPAQGAATLPTMRQFQHPLGVSATQEGTYSVPQIIGISSAAEKKLQAGKHISLDEALDGIKDEAQMESVVKNLALVAGQGKIAYDATGNIYAVDAAQHIDRRESYNVGRRKLNAFQFDHPQLHDYYAEIAGMLQDEFSKTEKGGQIVKFPGGVGENDTYIRTKRVATDRIAKLLDDEGMSYDDIDKALSAIVEDRGQENFAAAKRVELMIDEMLSNGYTDVYGYYHEPNREYIAAKNAIVGADGYEVKVVQLSDVFTDENVPGTEPMTRQDIARELAWRARMANEPAAPQVMGEVKLPELSADMEEAGMGLHDFTGNVETVPQEATEEILSALEDLSRDMEAPMETPTDATVRDAESLISAETVEAPQSLKEKAAESWAFFKRKMVDSGEAVTQIGKAINDKYLYPFYNMARASASAGANMIAEEQTDVNGRTVGESLNAIFDPIRAKGEEYYTQFQTYMYDLHNIARMSMDQKAKQEQETAEAALAAYTADNPKFINMTEAQAKRQADSIDELEAEEAKEYLRLVRWVNRAARMGNKPVFDYDFTAEMRRGRSERLLREHPEFAQYREQVRKYIDNLMKYRVDSGLITQQDADKLRAYYPDYIPTHRRQAFEDFGAAVKKKRVQIGKTVGRATGGNTKLVPLHEALGKQTMQVVREGSKNRFGARLLQDYTANASNADIARYVRNAEEYESDFSIDTFDSIDDVKPKRGNIFSVYFNGKLYDMTVDNALFEAVEALSPSETEQNAVKKVVHDVNKLYKALITGYNPTFAIRNTVRDIQSAGLYSRDLGAWAKNYIPALKQIFTDGEMWKQYRALGGDFSSVFDYMTGTVKKPTTKAGKIMDKVQALNMAMEQAPRLAEFMAVMEKGDGSMESTMDAMLAAADVTVNFGRSGTWGKMFNANYVPFLNPGIQGFDKMVRYATQSKNGKQFLMMAARAAALGIAPSLINALLYNDDEEWEELRDSDKDTNYMFKLKDGLWLKIPKGRELSVLGIAADRVGDAIRGEDVNIRAMLNTMANQVAPANPLNQNILKDAYDTQLFDPSSPGRTWYGGDIEGQRLQNYAPGERYDSSTDVVSKAIGGALNLSPKKINYLLDQYTGVVGDIVLPRLTPQAERDMFSKAFTVDSISSNELSGKFYEKSDELMYAKNGGDTTAAVVSRYWNHVGSEVSKLYGEIRDVENSDLSNREKKEQVQELQRKINAIQREALATVDQYTAAVGNNLFGYTDDMQDFAYRETNRDVFGSEYALKVYNKDVYAKAKEAVKSGGSYEDYYDYHFTTSDYSTAGKLNYLIESGMNTAEQSAIYYTAIATDNDEEKQQELEASVGLSREQYYQYRVATYGIKGDKGADGKTIPGSKRDKILAQINALDLTVAQKDALYLENGYAKDELYNNAPWYNIRPRL